MGNQAIGSLLQSDLMSLWDFGKPDYASELYRRYGKQGGQFLQLLRYMSREQMVTQDTFYGFEDNHIVENFTVLGTVSSGGPGTDCLVTISPADLDSLNHYYPRLDFIVTIPATEVQAAIRGIDVSVPTAPVLTLTPVGSTDDIGTLTAGTVIPITNGAWAEGSDQPDPAMRGVTKRTFYTQIFKESVGATGTQLTNAEWFNKFADDGTTITGMYSIALSDCEYRLSLIEDGAYLLGQPNTNNLTGRTGTAGAGNPISMTKGLIPHIRDNGNVVPYVPGTLTVTDFDALDLYLASQGVTDQFVLVLYGAKLAHEIENILVNYNKNTGIDMTRVENDIFGGSKTLATNVGFSSLTKGGRTFLFKRMDNFSNPKTFGSVGATFDQYGLMLPMNKVKDPTTGTSMPNFLSRYKGKGAYNRRYEVWDIRGTGGETSKYVSSIDRTNHYLRGNHGFMAMATNQLMMLDPS
jgi:hypothetical protein